MREKPDKAPLSVLIIDDCAEVEHGLIKEFTAQGHSAIGASDTHAALFRLSSGLVPDLIVTDMHIQDSVGKDPISHLRETAPQARILVYTARSEMLKEDVYRLRTSGADMVVQKGDCAELVQTVNDLKQKGWFSENPSWRRTSPHERPIEIRPALSREELMTTMPMPKFFVWWNDIKDTDTDALAAVLDGTHGEHDIQTFLEKKPILLIQHLGGGHGRWVIPQKRLGAELVTDFMIGHRNSIGFEWQAVELESPEATMFTRNGDPTSQLTHAIRQIEDWRAWLSRNQNYAARDNGHGGLGLTDIVARVPGLVLIGRRKTIDPITNDRRRQMSNDLGIHIHSYDFLLDTGRGRITALNRSLGK